MIETVAEAFATAARQWPDRGFLNILPDTAQVYGIAPGELSYAQAATQVAQLQEALQQAGYGPGHRVMLLLENRPAFFLWWLALNGLGASVVPVNPDLRHRELNYIITHCQPNLVVVVPDHLATMQAAASQMVPVIPPHAPLPLPGGKAGLAQGHARDAEAAMLYTSGTTGQPKGCILTNDYFLTAGDWYATAGGLCALTKYGERMITPLPIFHMNAMAYSFMAMIMVGGCLTVLDRFHPSQWWANVRDSGATCLHYLGVMPSILMNMPATANDHAHGVKFGFGAGVDPKLHAAFETRFGFPLVEAWAMTETGAGAVIAANDLPRRVGESCLGKPADWLEVRLQDDTGAKTDQGELLVRRKGPSPKAGFFAGYYKNKTATKEAWQDGWFHTGDIVRQDTDGSLFFVDRKKNVIRRSGENIAAVEVESALIQHPAISAAAVAPVPDPIRGDEVFAAIVTDTPSPELAEQITQWCLGQLAYYKAPGYIAFVDSLPLTPTQKIQRAALKTMAHDLQSDPATCDLRHLKKRGAT